MAYGLKYFFVDKKIVTTTEYTYRWELYEDGYVGSSTEWTGINIQRNYDQSSLRKINYIQKSSCTGNIRIEDQTQRNIIEGIADSEIGDWKVVLKKDGSVIWTGLLVPDLIAISEQNYKNQSASLVAKDLDIVGDYTLTTGRDSAIDIIAGILNILGYEIDIVSYTCWTETTELTSTDDILEQTYHEKGRFARFGKTDDEDDRPISNVEVLKWMLTTYGLVLRQANGVWNLIQISAFNTPTSVRRFVYDYTGAFQSKNLTFSLGSTTANSGDLRLFGSSSNTYFAGLKKVESKLQHDSIYQGIKFNREYWFPNTDALTRSQNWEADGTGNLTLEFTTWLGRNTSGGTDLGGNTVIGDVTIQCGTFFFDGSEWTETGTPTIEISVEDTFSTTDGDGNYVHKNQGLTIVTDPIPSGASGVLTVKIQPRGAIPQFEYMYVRDLIFNLQYSDTVEGSSTSIEYILESTLSYSEEYNFGTYYFGSGLPLASLASLTDSTTDILANFKRTYDSTETSHAELLLREVLDIRRTQKRSIRSVLYGEYEPDDIISYDSSTFFFFGGSWDSKTYQWSANLGEFNVERPSDVSASDDSFTAIYFTNGEGGYSGSVSGSTTGSTVPSSVFLEKTKNLSDLTNDATARQNLGVEIDVDVQAHDDQLDTLSGLSAGQASDLVDITEAEYTQIQNIDSVTISNTQWGYLGSLDQSLTTSSDVQFDDITASGTIRTNELDAQDDLVWNTAEEVWNTSDYYFSGSINLAGSLYITDELDVAESVSIGTTLDVSGNTTILGTLDAPTLNTGQGDNELYAMNQDVQTTDGVIFDTLSVTNSATVGGSLTLTGSADFNSTMNLQGDLTTQSNLQDDGYATGWSGTNWQIQADGSAELQELRVRGALRVFEFIAKQISTIGGSEILSIAQGRVVSVDSDNDTITVENVTGTAGNSFKVNDLFICQVTDINNDLESGGTGSIVKSVRGGVIGVVGNDIEVSITSGNLTDLVTGDLIVAYGNTTDADRQAIMYRNVDRSEDNLIMRLQTEVNSFADLQAVGNTRVAFGDLNGYSGLSSETFGFFAGDNSNEHILVTDGGLFLKDGGTTLAQLTSNTFKVGDGTNFLSFNGSSFDIQTDTFDLNTINLDISSANENIVIGTSSYLVTLGKLNTNEQGLTISTPTVTNQNFWKLSTGDIRFKVGDGTNYLEYNETAGSFEIKVPTFTLDATDASGGIKVESANQRIQLEDANRVRTQVDVNDGTFSLTETSEYNAGDATVINQGTASISSAFQTTKGDSLYIDVSAELTSLGADGSEAYIQVETLGSTSSGGSYTSFGSFLSPLATTVGNTVSVKFSAHSYSYDWVKIRITVFSDDTGFASQFELNQNIIVKSYDSQTRLSLDGLFVNSSNTQYARLTRSQNELSGIIKMKNLPTSDPQVEGVIYNDGGTLKISAG